MFSGRIQFILHEQQRNLYLPQPLNLAALQTLAQALAAQLSTAGVLEVAFTEAQPLVIAPRGGEIADILVDCHIRMKDSEGKTHCVRVPAPDLGLFDKVRQAGYRLKHVAGENVAAAYGAAKGLDMTFQEGWLVGVER